MKRFLLFFMLISLVFFAFSCSDDESEETTAASNQCNSNIDCARDSYCDLEHPQQDNALGVLVYSCKKRQLCSSQADCPIKWKCKESEGLCITEKEAAGILCKSNDDCEDPMYPICNIKNGECEASENESSDTLPEENENDSDNADSSGDSETNDDDSSDSDSGDSGDSDTGTGDTDTDTGNEQPKGETIMIENFEEGGEAWTVEAANSEAPCWQFGAPTSGPEAAHGGDNVAATVLDGDYPAGCNDLIYYNTAIEIPSEGVPSISFYGWVDINGKGYSPYTDYAEVLVKQDTDTWGTVSGLHLSANSPSQLTALDNEKTKITKQAKEQYYQFTGDLSAYKGKKIQFGFRFVSDASDEASGFYLDDIKISY